MSNRNLQYLDSPEIESLDDMIAVGEMTAESFVRVDGRLVRVAQSGAVFTADSEERIGDRLGQRVPSS